MNDEHISGTDSLLDELNTPFKPQLEDMMGGCITDVNPTELSEEDLDKYLLAKSAELIDTTMDSLKHYRKRIHSGCDAEEMDSYSKLINSASSAIANIAKISIQNKKDKNSLKLKELSAPKDDAPKNVTNNVIIASREEIMEKLFNNPDRSDAIDVTAN